MVHLFDSIRIGYGRTEKAFENGLSRLKYTENLLKFRYLGINQGNRLYI
jgi:hypothetical protein